MALGGMSGEVKRGSMSRCVHISHALSLVSRISESKSSASLMNHFI